MSDYENIIDTLKGISLNHEEPYRDGAWEDFVKSKKQKRRVLWPAIVSGIAASFIVLITVFNWNKEIIKKADEISAIQPKKENREEIIKDKINGTRIMITSNESLKPNNSGSSISEKINKVQVTTFENGNKGNSSHKINHQTIRIDTNTTKLSSYKIYDTVQSKSDTLIDKSQIIEQLFPDDSQVKNNKLVYGFMLSPIVTSTTTKSNMGIAAGFQTDFTLVRNIALNSGLSIAHYQVGIVNEQNNISTEPVAITTKIFSFDLPLNIKIKIKSKRNKDSYLLAGISSVGYLNERSTYTYRFEEVIEYNYTEGNQEYTAYKTVVSESESNSESPAFSTINFAGFFNFSYGLNYKISGNIRLALEPYIKLPLQELSSNNLRYSCGGISLILSK